MSLSSFDVTIKHLSVSVYICVNFALALLMVDHNLIVMALLENIVRLYLLHIYKNTFPQLAYV